MNLKISRFARALTWAIAAAGALSVAGCGGGGGSDATTPPAKQSLSGVVIDGPIQGATVCLDLNKNGACDAGEPTSAATSASGSYTISDLTADQINSGAPLVAIIPANAVDASNPTGTVGTAYKLTSLASKPGVISPITTLVQAGVAQGLTQSTSEATVATQLQVAAANLYNNYTSSSTGDNAVLASLVPTIVTSLQAGETPVVSPAASSTAGYWVRAFTFTNSSNYFLRYYYSTNVPDANGIYTFFDERVSLSAGAPVSTASLYDTALFPTTTGWKAFDGSTANTSTTGSPSVSTYGYGYTYANTRTDTDVSGQSLASVVAQAQDMTKVSVSTLVGVDASKLSGTLPTGSKIRKITTVSTASPIAYRVSDGFVAGTVTTLAGLVAAYPVPGTPTAANTVTMSGLHGNAGCGTQICLKERLRVAFGASNAATYYLCDIDTATGAQTNCSSIGTGTYSLGTAADGSSPIMKFAGLPASTNVQTFTRVFIERSGHVYFGWQDKPTNTTQIRLNKVAFEALAAALGITPPTIGDTASAYAGNWSATYAGSDTGSCSTITIDAGGHMNGSCVSTTVGGTFIVSGSVNSSGVATFTASGSTSSGATFTGSFAATSGSGTWTWPSHSATGTWSATKL